MLVLKKLTGASNRAPINLWRPDFRNTQTLPDVKTVRTKFLLNALLASVVGAVALFSVERELTTAVRRDELSAVEAKIAELQPQSDRAVAEYRRFQAEEKVLREALVMRSATFSFTDYMLHLSKILPAGITINRVDFRGIGQSIVVGAARRGTDSIASEAVTNFVSTLKSDSVLQKQFLSVDLVNLSRNPGEGVLSFEVVFNFRKEVKK